MVYGSPLLLIARTGDIEWLDLGRTKFASILLIVALCDLSITGRVDKDLDVRGI